MMLLIIQIAICISIHVLDYIVFRQKMKETMKRNAIKDFIVGDILLQPRMVITKYIYIHTCLEGYQ